MLRGGSTQLSDLAPNQRPLSSATAWECPQKRDIIFPCPDRISSGTPRPLKAGVSQHFLFSVGSKLATTKAGQTWLKVVLAILGRGDLGAVPFPFTPRTVCSKINTLQKMGRCRRSSQPPSVTGHPAPWPQGDTSSRLPTAPPLWEEGQDRRAPSQHLPVSRPLPPRGSVPGGQAGATTRRAGQRGSAPPTSCRGLAGSPRAA